VKTPFEKIRDGLVESAAHAAGEDTGAILHKFLIADVKRIRAKTKLSQAKFAAVFHIPVGTLRNWEQGLRRPEGPAIALLHIIDKDPAAAVRALHG